MRSCSARDIAGRFQQQPRLQLVPFAGQLQCLSHDVLLYTRAAYCVRPPVRYTYEFCQNG